MSERQEKQSSPRIVKSSNGASARTEARKKRSEDYKFGRELGHGSFATVYLAQDVESGTEVAIKVIEKKMVIRNNRNWASNAIWMERYVLQNSDHPLVCRLILSFHDMERLYYVLPYAPNGELGLWLHKSPNGRFDVETVRFYISELILALEYLHSKEIIHRDIKPENMLLGPKLHLMLVDFGSAIVLNNSDIKPVPFTGTAQFVSPEMLTLGYRNSSSGSSGAPRNSSEKVTTSSVSNASDSRTQSSEATPSDESGATSTISDDHSNKLKYLMDFWALGCVLYQLLTGQLPFRSKSRKLARNDPGHDIELFQKILNLDYQFPENFPDESAKDLISRLLIINPADRLGNPASGRHLALKQHPFLRSVDWDSDLSFLVERTPPKFMLNLVNASKLTSGLPNSLHRMNSSNLSNNTSFESDKFWNSVPVGFEAGQQYIFRNEIHQDERGATGNSINSEKARIDESHIDIEGGALVRYLVDSGVCLAPQNDIVMPNKELYLAHQRNNNPYDQFTQGRLILDYGILYKRRKLRARKRMFLMVEDIRLLYVDPDAMELKGIVRLSALSTFELRNSKTFVIRTPGRDYILEDPCECAQEWVERVRRYWSLFYRSPT